jgi:ParB family transcriptional regulator, chromosome partitioning protein
MSRKTKIEASMPPRVTTKMIGLAGIAVSDRRLRKIRPETVDELAESILQQGLLHPIRLRPRSHNGSGYILIAGQHRLEAARKLHKRKLGPDHIRAEIVDDLDANAALLAEIDENLLRADLSPIERALHVARRKELYELEHPKTVHGGDRKRLRRKKSRSQNENLKNFVDDAARKTGKGRSTIARDAARGNLDGIGDAIGTSLDKGEELDHLIRLPADRRDALIARAKGGEKVSAKTESKKVRRADREQQLAESTAAAAVALGQRMSRSYRQEAEQERQRRDAERSALERDLALQRAREFGRGDLAELLEAGEISAGEAFFRLHARR